MPCAYTGIERARRVTHDDEAVREAPHLFVSAPAILGGAIPGDWRQRLSLTNRVVQDRAAQAACERQKTGFVRWRVVAADPGKRHVPAIAFERKDHTATRMRRRRRLHVGAAPFETIGVWDAVDAARISEKSVDHLFSRTPVAHRLEP